MVLGHTIGLSLSLSLCLSLSLSLHSITQNARNLIELYRKHPRDVPCLLLLMVLMSWWHAVMHLNEGLGSRCHRLRELRPGSVRLLALLSTLVLL